MSTYKPSFIFQSQINEIPNISTSASAQASPDSVEGSTNPNDVSSIINPNDIDKFTYSVDNLSGSSVTSRTIYSDPSVSCGIIDTVNRLLCDQSLTPSGDCLPPKQMVISADGTIKCSCPGTEKYEFDDSNIDSIMDSITNCRREAKNKAYNDCLESSNLSNILNGIGSFDPIINSILQEVKNKITETLNDRNYTIGQKGEEAAWILQQAITALSISDFPTNDLEGILNQIQEITANCASFVDNDCVLNTVPSASAIKVSLGLVNTKEKVCSGDLILNDECECVCPSGSVVNLDGSCLNCTDGQVPTIKPEKLPLGGYSYECACPSGTVQYNLPTNMGPRPDGMQMTPCVPECPEGYTFKEIPMGPGGPSDCTYVIDDRCYDCVCRKGPSNYWQNPILVPEEACADDARPDPDNQCKCKCNNEKHTYYYGDSELSEGCYCGTELQLPTEKLRAAFCNHFQLPLNGDTSSIPDTNHGMQWDHETCECVCPSGSQINAVGKCECNNSNHVWAVFNGCICPAEYQMDGAWNPSEYCNTEATGKTWDNDICQCVCPSGTNYDPNIEECVCATGATVTSAGAPSSAADCECPAGKTIQQDSNGTYVCASGSYTYTNLTTSELAKIASNFGYSFNNNMELL